MKFQNPSILLSLFAFLSHSSLHAYSNSTIVDTLRWDQCAIFENPEDEGTSEESSGENSEEGLDHKFALALLVPTLNGIQKIIEGSGVSYFPQAALVGHTSTILKLANNIYKASDKPLGLDNVTYIGDLVSDVSLLGANYFQFHYNEDVRHYYSTLKATPIVNFEGKKITKIYHKAPSNIDLFRHGSVFCARIANEAFKHYRFNNAVTGVIVLRVLNHAYEIANTLYEQNSPQINKWITHNLVLGSILAAQVPLQYFVRPGFLGNSLGVFLLLEYVAFAYLTYE